MYNPITVPWHLNAAGEYGCAVGRPVNDRGGEGYNLEDIIA